MRPRAHPLCIRPDTLYKNLATRPNFFARSLVITVAIQFSSGPKSSSRVRRARSTSAASRFFSAPQPHRRPVCASAVVCSRCLLALQPFFLTGQKSLRAPTFRVNKGDHHELAPGPAILVFYSPAVLVFCTIVLSRRRFCGGSVRGGSARLCRWPRRAAISAECQHAPRHAAIAGGAGRRRRSIQPRAVVFAPRSHPPESHSPRSSQRRLPTRPQVAPCVRGPE